MLSYVAIYLIIGAFTGTILADTRKDDSLIAVGILWPGVWLYFAVRGMMRVWTP